jgi:hypothetical protein
MAHFAEIDQTNIVLRVIVVDNKDTRDQEGKENEAIGAKFCHDLLGGRWVQTSYNGNIRGSFAGIGYLYDPIQDIFIAPQETLDQEQI